MFTETSPISVAVKPASTQNGFTMKPIDESPSLKIRMNASTGQMCGRARSSISAPNIGPCAAASALFDSAAPPQPGAMPRLPIHQTASAATAVPSAMPQNARIRASTTSSRCRRAHSAPSARPSTIARSFGSVTMRAQFGAQGGVAARSTVRSRGASSTAAAHAARIAAAQAKAPGQVIQSDRISTNPEASMPTR